MKEKELHDVNQLPSDGYIVFPLSMSRISNAQNSEECYKWLAFFEKKISVYGLDAVFLYTNGLYYNDNSPALEVRKKTNGQMISHSNAIRKLVIKKREFMPQAMHFVPWDYIVLNCSEFEVYYNLLKKLDKEDKKFHAYVLEVLKDRKESEANVTFILEEIAVTHLIRQRMIDFPKTLVKKDNFRLIAYPGPPLKADIYQWQKKVLPRKEKDTKTNPYYASHYDLDNKVIYNFDEINLD
ncbi:hypothetical protein KA107_02020 [Candidatus Pacearchaeota archaeon]|nr:hypothetical protein [Candidatus Pacearchaeota archaeon]